MIDSISVLLDNRFFETCGWVFLHFLWQALLVLGAMTITLFVVRQSSPRGRYAVSWAAMLILVVCPVITLLVVVPRSGSNGDDTRMISLLGLYWVMGALVLSLRKLVQVIAAELNRVVGARPVTKQWRERAKQLARQIGVRQHVRVVESSFIGITATVGWRRPVILLTRSALYGLTEKEMEAVLAHELAHVRRRDFIANLAQSAIAVVFFFHPAVWWISGAIQAERECCCDDWAASICGDRHVYGRALYHLELARAAEAKLAMSATGGVLKWRIQRLFGLKGAGTSGILDHPVLITTGILFALILFAITDANSYDGLGRQPEVSRQLVIDEVPYEGPGKIVLPAYGRVAFRGHITKTEGFQEFKVWTECRGSVAIQLVPLTKGFEPFLATWWPCLAHGEHNDGDLGSGRGWRPFQRIVLNYGEPRNWLRFHVCCVHETEEPEMPTKEADYVAVIWQPRVHNDIDPNVLGPEASPVLPEGQEYPFHRTSDKPAPALDYAQDIDVFQVRTATGAMFRITVDGTVGKVDPYLRVYDDAGELLARATTGREHVASTVVKCPRGNERLYFAVTARNGKDIGQYRVKVIEKLKTEGHVVVR